MINYIDRHSNSQKSFKKIFAFIVKKGKTTRREIQKFTNYSWSSVSSVVSVLINQGYVYEAESINYGVGRNTTYLIPNGNVYVSIGIDINSIGFTSTIIGVDGTTINVKTYPYSQKTKQYVMDTIFKAIDDCLEFIEGKYKLVSIGISCQGETENHSTFKRFSFCDEFYDVNLKEILEDKYDIHTYIEHDTNCLLEDYIYNYSTHPEESVCVARVVSGIGFAISVNGQPVEKYGPIDFGHMIVQPINGPKCMCGQYGCLEAYASTTGIVNRAGVEDFSIIDENREQYRDILDDAAFYLGVTLANLKQIFDLKKLVITGNVVGEDAIFLEKVNKASESVTSRIAKVSFIKDLNAAYGAARLSLKNKVDLKGEIE